MALFLLGVAGNTDPPSNLKISHLTNLDFLLDLRGKYEKQLESNGDTSYNNGEVFYKQTEKKDGTAPTRPWIIFKNDNNHWCIHTALDNSACSLECKTTEPQTPIHCNSWLKEFTKENDITIANGAHSK